MSIPARRFYDPSTPGGTFLGEEKPSAPVIHECGVMVLDRSWNYRMVCSPFWRAYLNFSSGASIVSAGVRYPIGPDRVLILPEEVVYHCLPKVGVRHLWVHFSPSVPVDASGPVSLPLAPAEARSWLDMAGQITRRTPAPLLAARCSGLLLPLLSRAQPASVVGLSPGMESLIRWLDTRLSDPPPVAGMAARVGMSVRSFVRWFREETSASPAAWLTRRRIRESCRLLRFSTQSIEQIAESTGFANRHHLSRVFKAETGTSPSAFRRRE